jgi:SAM-dependent methyltransferase
MPHQPATPFDPAVPAPARIYDYLLGGKDNYPADRQAAAQAVAAVPDLPELAYANRAFLTGAVRAAADAGITQFLDLGAGIPTSPNVHETAQAVRPAARVVYVDNDPVVLAHSRADRRAPGTHVIQADIRDPAAVLKEAGTILDLGSPVAILMISVLHFIGGDIAPLVGEYKRAAAPGSWLVISHAASDGADPGQVAEVADAYRHGRADPQARTEAEIRALFDGWELRGDPPGLTDVREWAGPAAGTGPVHLRMPAGIAVRP